MRRFLLLLALPLLSATRSASAHTYDEDGDRSYPYEGHRREPEVGIALEASRSGQSFGLGPGMTAGYLGMHGRLGRRVGLGFGIEQGYGDDPSGWKRYDIGWNLPKLYV